MSKKYTTKLAIENYLLITIEDSFNTQIDAWIEGMTKFIDRHCNRIIWAEDEETFKYDGDGSDMIVIKDCIAPVVTVDGVTKAVYTYPTNKEYASRIRLDGYKFTKGIQNVHVTGLQAMNLYLPEDIIFACTVLVAGIVRGQIMQDKAGTTERIGDYSITYNNPKELADLTAAKQILSTYKRIAL